MPTNKFEIATLVRTDTHAGQLIIANDNEQSGPVQPPISIDGVDYNFINARTICVENKKLGVEVTLSTTKTTDYFNLRKKNGSVQKIESSSLQIRAFPLSREMDSTGHHRIDLEQIPLRITFSNQ